MRSVTLAALLTSAITTVAMPADAQTPPTLDAIVQRLEQLDQQNASLRAEVQAQVSLQAGRLSEQEQVKAQSAQRVPIHFTGALLFSVFRNSEHGVPAGVEYPVAASIDSAPAAWAASVRRSIIGVEFQTPEAALGGQFRAAAFADLTEAGDTVVNIQPRLRTATIEGRWNRFAIMVGQDRPMFTVRDPTSLAQVQFAPLTGAGNFWPTAHRSAWSRPCRSVHGTSSAGGSASRRRWKWLDESRRLADGPQDFVRTEPRAGCKGHGETLVL
jgi:hypothetical protein